jgi:hypothetical protein
VTTPIDVQLCKDFCQSPHLLQICALRNNFLHETNNILLLYIKNNVVQCIGADATNTHVYAHTYTPTHIYIYTCINICTIIYTHTLVHLCKLICSIGIIFMNMTWCPLGAYQLRNERKSSRIQWMQLNVIFQLKSKSIWRSKSMVK